MDEWVRGRMGEGGASGVPALRDLGREGWRGLLMAKYEPCAKVTIAQKPKFFIFPDWSNGQPGKIITSVFRAHHVRRGHAHSSGRRQVGLPSAVHCSRRWGTAAEACPGEGAAVVVVAV